jgi:hypothetical protein
MVLALHMGHKDPQQIKNLSLVSLGKQISNHGQWTKKGLDWS